MTYNMNGNNLTRKIMTRVYLLFIVRKLKNPIVFEMSVFTASFLLLAYMVSLEHIIANIPHDIGGFYRFWVSAFLNTKLITKIVTVIMFIVTGVFVKNTFSYIYTNAIKLTRINRLFIRA